MTNDKNNVPVFDFSPNMIREIHKEYGLCMINTFAGGRTHPDSFYHAGKRGWTYYAISHMYDGYGHVWIDGVTECDMEPGDAVVVTPRKINVYGGYAGKPYCEDTINFVGPIADMLFRSGVLSSGVFHLGAIRKLRPIIELQQDPARDAQIRGNMELQKLLVDLYLDRQSSGKKDHPLFDKLVAEIKEHPERWWSLEEMSELCNLSDDQLRRVFLRRTGCSPKRYVDRIKLNQAADRLVSSKESVAEIARAFGYLDAYHFSRRFKDIMGVSPLQFRRSRPETQR